MNEVAEDATGEHTGYKSADFDALYRHSDDPWGFRTRWYEERKRAILMACLPRRRFFRAFEPGCANGELALELAGRCESLLACDFHPQALALARRRLAGRRGVETELRSIPEDWPLGRFDLIVFSELGYYLDRDALERSARKARDALSADGVLVACHWRHPIVGASLSAEEVHLTIGSALGQAPMVEHREPDFLLQLWFNDARSIAEREGLL